MKTFVTFYADLPNRFYYQTCCMRLKQQFELLNLPFYYEKKETKQNYLQNCLMKPQYILDCLNKLNTDIFWIDADSNIVHFPEELTTFINQPSTYDLGFVIKKDKSVPESALIYFNNTDNSKKFIQEWIDRSNIAAQTEEELDHPLLMDMFLEKKNELNYKSFNHDVCRVGGSKIQLIMSKEPTKRETELKVINSRKKKNKIW